MVTSQGLLLKVYDQANVASNNAEESEHLD